MSVSVSLVWAQSDGGIIGNGGTMPWYLPEDLAHFAALTLGSPVIMGRKTWESLPERFRPLPGRHNVVVTRQPDWSASGAEVAHSVDAAIEQSSSSAGRDGLVWIIGGAEIYSHALTFAQRLEITEIRESFIGDTRAPERGDQWELHASDPAEGWHLSSTGLHYRFLRYENHNVNQR